MEFATNPKLPDNSLPSILIETEADKSKYKNCRLEYGLLSHVVATNGTVTKEKFDPPPQSQFYFTQPVESEDYQSSSQGPGSGESRPSKSFSTRISNWPIRRIQHRFSNFKQCSFEMENVLSEKSYLLNTFAVFHPSNITPSPKREEETTPSKLEAKVHSFVLNKKSRRSMNKLRLQVLHLEKMGLEAETECLETKKAFATLFLKAALSDAQGESLRKARRGVRPNAVVALNFSFVFLSLIILLAVDC